MTVNKIQVRLMSDEDLDLYDKFVLEHGCSLIYYSQKYIKLISALTESEQRTLLALDQFGTILGVLPALLKQGEYGNVLNSLPYYGSNGGVLATCEQSTDVLLSAYNNYINSKNIASATLVSNPIGCDLSNKVDYSVTDARIGQFTDIFYTDAHAGKLMQLYHYKTRNMIRKAQKSDISVDEENHMVEFLMITHQANMKAIGGREKDAKFFELFPTIFKAGSDFKIYVSRIDNKPVAALLLFYFRNTVEYYMPVICEEYRDKQPMSLLIYHAMTEASRNNYSIWNWGGTWKTQEGVYLFKSRWGTYDKEYIYYTKINNPNIYHSTKSKLLSEYPDFYVIPFNLLN